MPDLLDHHRPRRFYVSNSEAESLGCNFEPQNHPLERPSNIGGDEGRFPAAFLQAHNGPGCVFFSDSDDARMEHYLEVINNRRGQKDANFTAAEVSGWSDAELQQHLFPAGFNARFQSWKDLRNETHGDGDLPFIFDGDHHPGQSSSGTDFPPLLTHGHIIRLNNDDTWQLATPQEHYKSLGYKFPNKLGDIFKKINALPSTWKNVPAMAYI